jgi:hypothetical protein
MLKRIQWPLIAGLLVSVVGCGGSSEAIIPSTPLTDEQKAAVKVEDDSVADEESQGSNKKKK